MTLRAIARDLFYERSGKRVSLSRTQFWLAWTIFIPTYLRAAWSSATIPDVPQGWVALLGVSGAVYAASKAIARQREDGRPYPYDSHDYLGKGDPHK